MTEKKRALLVVAGGRALPEVLALFHLQPDLVIYLISEEGWLSEKAFNEIATSMPSHERIYPITNVSAYNFEAAKDTCLKACEPYPETEWDWTFTISTGPKITCIAAYEVAKQKGYSCIYIDTSHEKIHDLTKGMVVENKELFHISINDYMKVQRRSYEKRNEKTLEYRSVVELWGPIARDLALSPYTSDFTVLVRDKHLHHTFELSEDLIQSPLVKSLEHEYNLIQMKQQKNGAIAYSFTSEHAAKFLGTGDWLEVYVWNEAREANFADDYQWGYCIADGKAKNELDLAITYRSQLIIGECKTDNEPFGKKKYWEAISSNANLLGGSYVTKLFITNQPKTKSGYANFQEQASRRQIVIVTAEDLADIGQILKREADKPTYSRI